MIMDKRLSSVFFSRFCWRFVWLNFFTVIPISFFYTTVRKFINVMTVGFTVLKVSLFNSVKFSVFIPSDSPNTFSITIITVLNVTTTPWNTFIVSRIRIPQINTGVLVLYPILSKWRYNFRLWNFLGNFYWLNIFRFLSLINCGICRWVFFFGCPWFIFEIWVIWGIWRWIAEYEIYEGYCD